MNVSINMYALKCKEGYIKVEADGGKIVGMNKASVYGSMESLRTAVEGIELPEGILVVELIISEREIGSLDTVE